jgi:hypothetical protein
VHRKKLIINKTKRLSEVKPRIMCELNGGPVARWLQTFACDQYAHAFELYGYDTLEKVCQLDMNCIVHMGVTPFDCERICDNVCVLRQTIQGRIRPYNFYPKLDISYHQYDTIFIVCVFPTKNTLYVYFENIDKCKKIVHYQPQRTQIHM